MRNTEKKKQGFRGELSNYRMGEFFNSCDWSIDELKTRPNTYLHYGWSHYKFLILSPCHVNWSRLRKHSSLTFLSLFMTLWHKDFFIPILSVSRQRISRVFPRLLTVIKQFYFKFHSELCVHECKNNYLIRCDWHNYTKIDK